MLRKQNLSVHDISRAFASEGELLSPAAITPILREKGFAKLPRRLDDERPDQSRPFVADMAGVRRLDLTLRAFRTKDTSRSPPPRGAPRISRFPLES